MKEVNQVNTSNQQALSELSARLLEAGVDLECWGSGEAKTLGHLLKEIEEGETELINTESGLLRILNVVGINVYYQTGRERYWLKEEKQVFSDGRERRRSMDHSVSEKMKSGETSEDAFKRGLLEELSQITKLEGSKWVDDVIFSNRIDAESTRVSNSYPGLVTKYVKHFADMFLTAKRFLLHGYIEEQDDKKTYFVWKEFDSSNS